MRPNQTSQPCRRAFTLIEVLLAVSVFAIVLIAINTVFYSALRLRQSTVLALDASTPIQQVSSMMKRDLQCALPPGGIITGDFKCGSIGGTMGAPQAEGIEFCTTTGILTPDTPWGDVRKVSYQLRDAAVRSPMGGRELIRSVTRNLLSTTQAETDDQFLMSDVDSLEFLCYDGMNWRNTWDTSLSDTNLPTAVKVRIQLSSDRNLDTRSRAPIEMVVSLFSQSLTNQVSTTDTTTQ
jgi:type II secretion system protein J